LVRHAGAATARDPLSSAIILSCNDTEAQPPIGGGRPVEQNPPHPHLPSSTSASPSTPLASGISATKGYPAPRLRCTARPTRTRPRDATTPRPKPGRVSSPTEGFKG
jgi:hypothetical protein